MKNSMAILLSFVAGAMSALCVSPFFRHDTVNAKMPKVSSSEAMRPESEDAAAISRLQERLSGLERQLAYANSEVPRETHESTHSKGDVDRSDVGETEEDRQKRLETALEKIDFLFAIEVDGMGRQERRSHERLLKKLARREELTDMIESSMSQEERDALILERKEVEDSIRDLNQKVRQNLLSIVARNLGVEKESAKDVVKVIVEIIKMTE